METTKTLQTTAKTVQAKTYLCHTQKTTLSKMMEKIGEQVDDLYQAVTKHGLEKAGVIEFIWTATVSKTILSFLSLPFR